jgi:rod shape-determining protein MreD
VSARVTVLALLAALVLDVGLLPAFVSERWRPSFLLAVVTYVALSRRAVWGVVVGALTGFLIDALSPGRFGAYGTAGIVVGFLLGNLWHVVYRDRWPAQALALVAAVCLTDLVANLVNGLSDPGDLAGFLVHRSLPVGVSTGLLCPLLFAWLVATLHLRIRWEHGAQTARRRP